MQAQFQRQPLPQRFCNFDRLIDTMKRREVDGLVAYSRQNVFYLSGFPPHTASPSTPYGAIAISRHAPDHPVAIIPDYGVAYFLTQPTWIEDIRAHQSTMVPLDIQIPGDERLKRFVPPSAQDTNLYQHANTYYAESLFEGVEGALRDLGLQTKRVGFDDYHLASQFSGTGLATMDGTGIFLHARAVKTDAELDFIRAATTVNQTAIERTVASWQRGMSWREMVHTYDRTAVELGGFVRDPGGVVIANTVGADPAFYLQSGVEDFIVEPGMHIMWDCHGTWNNYCWDGGKTWVVDGDVVGKGRQIADATAASMQEVEAASRPGVRYSELSHIARDVYRKCGFTEADDIHILFHGLGLDHVDMELTTARADGVLEEGMVIAAHLQVPADDRSRNWLEQLVIVGKDGGEPIFSWDYQPIPGSTA